MQMLLKLSMPAGKGNEAIRSGALQKRIQENTKALKPEAASFYLDPASGELNRSVHLRHGGFVATAAESWSRSSWASTRQFVSHP